MHVPKLWLQGTDWQNWYLVYEIGLYQLLVEAVLRWKSVKIAWYEAADRFDFDKLFDLVSDSINFSLVTSFLEAPHPDSTISAGNFPCVPNSISISHTGNGCQENDTKAITERRPKVRLSSSDNAMTINYKGK